MPVTVSKIVAVTGITGHTGGFLLKEFIRNHFEECLRCLVRPSSNTFDLDHSGLNVEKVVGSVEDEEILASLVRDTDVVFHIVGIRFSKLLTKVVLRGRVKRLILVHTTGIFSKYRMAADDYKRIEDELLQITDRSTLDWTILRPTMIFGDLCDLNVSKFIRLVDCLPIMPEIDGGAINCNRSMRVIWGASITVLSKRNIFHEGIIFFPVSDLSPCMSCLC